MTIMTRAEVTGERRLRGGMLKEKVGSGMKSSCRFMEPSSLPHIVSQCATVSFRGGGQLSEILHRTSCANNLEEYEIHECPLVLLSRCFLSWSCM